jgi:hypothetical protein
MGEPMKRWHRIAALTASHFVVFATAAALTSATMVSAEFRRAHADPLTRLGMRFEAPPEALESFPSLEDDVRAAGKTLGPSTQRVLQLVGELRSNDMTGATRTCGALGWSHCEPAELNAMRKALAQ